ILKHQHVTGYSGQQHLDQIIPLSLTNEAYDWFRFEVKFSNWNDFKTRFQFEVNSKALGMKMTWNES
ncbi:unnamed protein product, partial [Allacma fusca]